MTLGFEGALNMLTIAVLTRTLCLLFTLLEKLYIGRKLMLGLMLKTEMKRQECQCFIKYRLFSND